MRRSRNLRRPRRTEPMWARVLSLSRHRGPPRGRTRAGGPATTRRHDGSVPGLAQARGSAADSLRVRRRSALRLSQLPLSWGGQKPPGRRGVSSRQAGSVPACRSALAVQVESLPAKVRRPRIAARVGCRSTEGAVAGQSALASPGPPLNHGGLVGPWVWEEGG